MAIQNSIILLTFLLSVLDLSIADFAGDVLAKHNELRALHGCPNLELDDKLNADAAAYAAVLASIDKLEHDKGPFGENLGYHTKDPLVCVQMWYDEIKDYDFDKAVFGMNTGHFTQLVWKSSTKLGAAKNKSGSGKYFIVARYTPAGNIRGTFKSNVPRKLKENKGDDKKKKEKGDGSKPMNSILLSLSAFLLTAILVQ